MLRTNGNMAALPATNHEKIRADLTKELELVVKAAIGAPQSSAEHVPSEITLNICNTIEAIFIHGLKDPFFLKGTRYAKYPEPNFWPFVSKYSHKNVTNQIVKLKQVKTEIGRSRAWIRIILNENSLDHYLNLLVSEKSAIRQFYEEHAFLRFLKDGDYAEQILGILKPLGNLSIHASTNSSFLNSWTPSPLILAGLLVGTPLRVGTLIPRRHVREDSITEEIAVSALDVLMPDGDATRPKDIYQGRRSRKNTHRQNDSDDDRSSTYSHPSMVDFGDYPSSSKPSTSARRPIPRMSSSNSFGHLPYPQSPLLTSTPLDSVILDAATMRKSTSGTELKSCILDEPISFSPLVVTRRLHKPRRSSKSSSGSNSVISGETARASRANTGVTTIVGTVPDLEADLGFMVDGVLDSAPEQPMESTEDVSKNHILEENYQDFSDQNVLEFSRDELKSAPFSDEPREQTGSLEKSEELRTSQFCQMPTRIVDSRRSDSILGTSLHDELMQAMSPAQSIEPEPYYVLPPSAIGNSLAAISVRNQMTWESMSDRSRMSSSSDSGPIISFDQALRSAMETAPFSSTDPDFTLSDSDFAEEPSRKNTGCLIATSETIEKLCQLPKEQGLDKQDFRCALCRRSIGGPTYAKFEKCAVDGMYYCTDCMCTPEKSPVPARVFTSWDWSEKHVSSKGKLWIDMNMEKPLMNISKGNPQLYEHVPKLAEVLELRKKLQIGVMYLFTCRESVMDDFRRRVDTKGHLHSDIHLYSFTDLTDVKSGAMEKKLKQLLTHTINHVMNCTLCKQKGFVCELCSSNQVIYPFQTETIHRCESCFAVYHKECFNSPTKNEAEGCPKCARRLQFEARSGSGGPAALDDPQMLILQP